MMLQEEIVFESYFRCYCIGGKHVRIMQYDPRNPHHLRYQVENQVDDQQLLQTIEDYTLKLNQYLGYDFNTVEFAVRDGIPYAIDFCNPAPDAERTTVGEENFEWVVETAATYAIERARNAQEGWNNLTWGQFVKSAAGAAHQGNTAGSAPQVTGQTATEPQASENESSKITDSFEAIADASADGIQTDNVPVVEQSSDNQPNVALPAADMPAGESTEQQPSLTDQFLAGSSIDMPAAPGRKKKAPAAPKAPAPAKKAATKKSAGKKSQTEE
jgi:hypothetical protein